ncbi:MAG TPA: TraR/DksA family transcriptional regulator [Acidimicrobiales bacterium]|nr:TraR/DksA family transcriptional regulator [Acidimicrobiales bacterium]
MPNDAVATEARALLVREQADLRRQLAELGHGGEGGLTYDSNFADSSQVTAERGEADALAAKLVETLEEVDAALAKIDGGTYGTCEQCGKEIAPARLEAKPGARYCIDCASKR